MTVFASGGIRDPLDLVKCLALGAKGVGIASTILRILEKHGVQHTIKEMNKWKEQLKVIFTKLGAKSVHDLSHCPIVITKEVREWCDLRGIDISKMSKRINNR